MVLWIEDWSYELLQPSGGSGSQTGKVVSLGVGDKIWVEKLTTKGEFFLGWLVVLLGF